LHGMLLNAELIGGSKNDLSLVRESLRFDCLN
jgi:hypothetical protein